MPHVEGSFGVGVLYPDASYDPAGMASLYGPLPHYDAAHPRRVIRNVLRAWDPVAQKAVWEQETSHGVFVNDGGVMSTGGNLVFQGRADGSLYAFAADTGKLLHTIDTGVGIMAAPMTYEVAGVQYVAVMAGYGGGAIATTYPDFAAGSRYLNEGRIIEFKLGGGPVHCRRRARTRRCRLRRRRKLRRRDRARRARVHRAMRALSCPRGECTAGPAHHRARGSEGVREHRPARGARALATGRFDDVLSEADAAAVHAYLISEARAAYQAAQSAAAPALKP